MNKFLYSENEIEFSRTQCGLCIFRNPDSDTSCQKYEQKPDEVLKGQIKCPQLCTTDFFGA